MFCGCSNLWFYHGVHGVSSQPSLAQRAARHVLWTTCWVWEMNWGLMTDLVLLQQCSFLDAMVGWNVEMALRRLWLPGGVRVDLHSDPRIGRCWLSRS